jgi:hypothetical protein
MGLTVLKLEVANAGNPAVTESVEFLIDSGAIYSIVPKAVLQRLGIAAIAEETFRLANGQTIRRQTGGPCSSIGRRRVSPRLSSARKATARS